MADAPKALYPDESDQSVENSSSRIIKLEAMVWTGSKEALQEVKDWGAPLLDPDVQNPWELHLRLAKCNVGPGMWDIIVKYDDGQFAVFSNLNTAAIFSRRP